MAAAASDSNAKTMQLVEDHLQVRLENTVMGEGVAVGRVELLAKSIQKGVRSLPALL
jgi:hypothetical protein